MALVQSALQHGTVPPCRISPNNRKADLGDYFAPGALGQGYSYYCIDGVCLLPPDAQPGKVCEPVATAPVPSKAAAYTALRYMMREQGVAAVAAKLAQRAQSHDEAQHTHVH